MSDTPIQSRDNRWIKRLRRAIDRHDREIALEGPKSIRDAIALGWEPRVILQEEGREPFHADAQPVRKKLFSEISDTTTSQGVIAIFERPYRSIESIIDQPPRRFVALDAVQDPGNVGTIIRLAAAFDVTAVIRLPGTADPWSPKVIRASAGAVMAVPIAESTPKALLDLVQTYDLDLFTADPDATDTKVPRTTDLVFVLGSEGQGISPELAERSRGTRIPMSNRVESLNVAAAAAIVLSRIYEGRA